MNELHIISHYCIQVNMYLNFRKYGHILLQYDISVRCATSRTSEFPVNCRPLAKHTAPQRPSTSRHILVFSQIPGLVHRSTGNFVEPPRTICVFSFSICACGTVAVGGSGPMAQATTVSIVSYLKIFHTSTIFPIFLSHPPTQLNKRHYDTITSTAVSPPLHFFFATATKCNNTYDRMTARF